MLLELDIEGYAVVDRLRVAFQPGLNLLTGETGSGKSIVVGCLALLFGSRARSDVVRAGARRARVSGRFSVPVDGVALARLAESGIGCEDDELIVERQVLAGGKSRAYVNGSPATVGLLRTLAPFLGDIHGQHAQQTLLASAHQLGLVDAFAGTGREVAALRAMHRRWRRAGEALERVRSGERERLQRMDMLRYQIREIRDADPAEAEDVELGRERDRLANAERLLESGFRAYDVLYDSSGSASSQVKSAVAALESIAPFDQRFAQFAESLEDARSIVDDVAFDLRGRLDGIEADPARQEHVESRLAELEKLKRKYGPSLADVLEGAADSERELAELDRSDQEIERLQAEFDVAAEEYAGRSSDLSRRRQEAASRLSARTEAELGELALARASLTIRLRQLKSWRADGVDGAAILFSANPGQPPRPLSKVASGGELSRVALALKTCLEDGAGAGPYRRTLVFDEVDSGVGGSVAEAIGRRLKRLTDGSQVLCVTHLPQIARFGDAHFHVTKSDVDGSATATVTELTPSRRVEELARMLSGSVVTAAAMENARQLLRTR